MRTVWTWLAIGGAILATYLAQTFFGLTGAQLATGFFVVCLMALSYQVNSLGGERPKLKKKFVNDLLFSEPITVKHDRPKSLTPDGNEKWGVEGHDFEFFKRFWYFGELVNRDLGLLQDAIRIQEISDTSMTGDLSRESPAYGRRYEIFHNQVKIGLLQIMASHHHRLDKQDQSVYAHVAIDRIPVTALPYQRVYGFLQTIAALVTSSERKPRYLDKTEYEEALSAINYQLAETMWNTLNNHTLGEPTLSELEVCLSGTPDQYYHREAHERSARMQARADQSSARRSA